MPCASTGLGLFVLAVNEDALFDVSPCEVGLSSMIAYWNPCAMKSRRINLITIVHSTVTLWRSVRLL